MSNEEKIARLINLVQTAYEEGFSAPATYNDVLLNTPEEEYADSYTRKVLEQIIKDGTK